jgi:cytochrome P450
MRVTTQPLAELNLPSLVFEDQSFRDDPLPYFVAARQKHPWLASCKFGIVVTEYGAMKDLMWKDDSMRTALSDVVGMMNAKGTPWGRFMGEQILAYHGDKHKRMRELLASAFSARQALRHRPLMRQTIAALLDQWVPKGAFDFEEFASNFPIAVMCRLIGAPAEIIPLLRDSMETLGVTALMLDPDVMDDAQKAAQTMFDSVEELIARRRAGERLDDEEDLLDILLAIRASDGMSEDELLNLLVLMFVAGYDTSKNVLTLTMNVLLDHLDNYARCAIEPEFCAKVVEENFRFLSVSTVPRVTTRDIDYRDVRIPEGTMLWFPLSVAGRDPSVAPDADHFNPEREHKNRHIGFGRGMHMCLGQHIARAQIEEGLHQVAQRITNPRRAGSNGGWRPFTGTWGMSRLPITFDPA